jgi:hypothetical protein
MKTITLTRDKVAIVDDEDYRRVAQYKWLALEVKAGVFYAARSVRVKGGKSKWLLMHRLLGRDELAEEVDHWNGDTLDNRRENLRPCTHKQNRGNMRSRSKSGFKGVTWHKRQGRWMAQIGINYTVRFLGYFDDPAAAARAYDVAARIHFGEFARLNFPTKSEVPIAVTSHTA